MWDEVFLYGIVFRGGYIGRFYKDKSRILDVGEVVI